MNEKYEIIIKENGEEKTRVSAKCFVLTAMREEGIHKLAKAAAISRLEVVLLTNANEELVDDMWAKFGVESRKEREVICKIAKQMVAIAAEEDEE